MPDESRATALDPELLTAEIALLLDYLSGVPERTVNPTPRGAQGGQPKYGQEDRFPNAARQSPHRSGPQ
jgi:hypothetical protein